MEHAGRASDTTHDLYSQYGKQIYAYCLHKLRSREEAEDAVQTTFMNAFRSLQRGTSTEYEQAWLYKIAHNVCIQRQTSASRRLRLEAPNDFEVLQEVVPAREGDGDGSLELMGIEEALEAMPENQRRAILLREWQGLSYREISAELGLSQAAVEMLIFRARRWLAGALEQPEEAKRARVGRRVVGGFASVAGALKTLLGGGAAIKAVSIAAAAIAVVGESAQHTIVHAKKTAPASRHVAAAAVVAPPVAHTVTASAAVVAAPVAHRLLPVAVVTRTRHVVHARPVVHAPPMHAAPVHVVAAAPVEAAPGSPPPAAPEPAPAAAPAPQPAPAAAVEPPKSDDHHAEAPAPQAAAPSPVVAADDGKGKGRDKDKHEHGRTPSAVTTPQPAPVPAPDPTAPQPEPAPAPVALEAAAPAAEVSPAPAPVEPVHADQQHGNGHGWGKDKEKPTHP
ncbi:MAG TPA: sigma-70 family RNA polymerase sigma factor [Gaiellaceae bacterium]